MAKKTFDTNEIDNRDRYKLMAGLVVPRPIGWIGTRASDDSHNVAPYSFFNMVAGTPPTVLFTTGMTARVKDTLVNVRATGEFTVNIVTEEIAERMVLTSGEYGPGVDEFELAGLTAVAGTVVGAPMVGEAVANMECTATRIVETGEPATASTVFGEVLRIHVDDRVLDGTRIDHDALRAVGRMAGDGYTRTADRFELQRPG